MRTITGRRGNRKWLHPLTMNTLAGSPNADAECSAPHAPLFVPQPDIIRGLGLIGRPNAFE